MKIKVIDEKACTKIVVIIQTIVLLLVNLQNTSKTSIKKFRTAIIELISNE